MDRLIQSLVDLFQQSHPFVQLATLALLIGGLIAAIVFLIRGRGRLQRVKRARDDAEDDLETCRLEKAELRSKLAELTKQRDSITESLEEAREEVGKHKRELTEGANKTKEIQDQLSIVTRERDGLASRLLGLRTIDQHVWTYRGDGQSPFPPVAFAPKGGRKTRFVSFLNLKGGVGKTTLVGNLGAAYATNVLGSPLRVLVVDLDFQGTLSNRCVDRPFREDRRNPAFRRTSDRLLNEESIARGGNLLVQELMVAMSGTQDHGHVIVADDHLDHIDFRLHVVFVAHHTEVRFCHRRIFHAAPMPLPFDLVLFDCPPRLTTSTVNALLASDYVIIPTSPDPNDIEAVPRTLAWMDVLRVGQIDFQAQLAGVIVNGTYQARTTGDLISNETASIQQLRTLLLPYAPMGNVILTNCIPLTNDVGRAVGSVALGASKLGRTIYGDVAKELYERIRV